MNKKISRNGIVSLISIGIIVLVAIGYFVTSMQNNEEPVVAPTKEFVGYVSQDAVLKTHLLDFVTSKNEKLDFSAQVITIEAGEQIAGVTIHEKHSYEKYIQLLAPDENAPKLNNSSVAATHNAYLLVLVGDVAHYRIDGQDVYEIENARVTYNIQSLLVEEQYNSVYIASLDTKKEKFVKIPEYKEALTDIEQYQGMLQW